MCILLDIDRQRKKIKISLLPTRQRERRGVIKRHGSIAMAIAVARN